MKTHTLLATALLLAASSVMAAEQPVEAAEAARAQAQTIGSFIDPMTILIVRIDLTRIDADATIRQIEDWQNTVIEDPKALREAVADMRKELQGHKDLLTGLREAGGRDLYVVLSLANVGNGNPFFGVLPVGGGVDGEALAKAARRIFNPGASTASQRAERPQQPATEVTQIRGAVVAASPDVLTRLQAMEPASQQVSLQPQFETVAGSAVQLVAVYSQEVRAVLAAMFPMGDEEQVETVRESIQTMIRSLRWIAVGIDTPPQTRVRIVVQTSNASDSHAFQTALKRAIDLTLEKGHGAQGKVLRELAQLILPEPQGDRLTRTLSGEQIDKVVAQLAPSMEKARHQAKRAFSCNNIAQFVRGMHIYYGQKKAWPDDLRQIIEVSMRMPYSEDMDLLTNPQRPGMKPAYIYLKPGQPITRIANPGETIAVYENFDEWGEGINVGYLDGHATLVPDQATFQKHLAYTKSLGAAAVSAVPATQKAAK